MSQTNVVSGFAKLTQLFLFIFFVYALHQGWLKIISRQTLLKHAEISKGH
jgi:hypothetical protein